MLIDEIKKKKLIRYTDGCVPKGILNRFGGCVGIITYKMIRFGEKFRDR